MWKKIIQLVIGKDCELRERMFRIIILIGGAVALIGTAESLVLLETGVGLIPLFLLLLVMGISLFATFRYRRIDLAAVLVGLLIIVIVFPIVFFMNGGIEGGATVWYVLGLFYMFVMFSGKRLFFFLFLTFLMYFGTYWVGYLFPELITPMSSKAAVYNDSMFSVFAVGLCGGIILKIQMRIFEVEHKVTVEQKEELEKNSNAQNAFFANMSHEIRTPINTIIGLNELILRSEPAGELREYALDIQLASKMLLSQVNDVLDLSQMEMKKMKIIPVEYRTEELFGELVELIRVRLEKKELEFFVDIDRNLPAVLFGDEKRLRQVFLNILDNAVKYTKEGSVTLSVQREESREGEILLKVKIADTGMGIRKEDMEYIYDSFNRADEKQNRRIEGSGLGLAITRQLVELMDGEITADSIYMKGTVFTVTLKQKVVDATPIGEVNFLKRGGGPGMAYQPSFEAPDARILVVDDNRMNTKVASRLLAPTRVQVDIAGSGAECLEMTKRKYYHVILMDYMMPGMNGMEALWELRNQENGLCRDSAVIVMTANALSGDRESCLAQGFDSYVEKPVRGEVLEAEILRFLPDDIIEYQEKEKETGEQRGQIQRIIRKKRKKVYITSECSCDIPPELLEKYDIKLMYLYIKTPHGRFADTREIDADSLKQYISTEDSSAYMDLVTVEEYEEFFAECLTEAESVIHIAMGSCLGESYHTAVMAAKGFDHVHVVDSGQISCGQGLITLWAAKMALDGRKPYDICEQIEKRKGDVQTKFVMPGADIFYQTGRTQAVTAKICRLLGLHPLVETRQKRVVIVGFLGGSIEEAWKRGIRLHLRKKRKICPDVVFVTHVGCSIRQQNFIRREIRKRFPFEKIIMQKASFSTACNAGLQTIGISYYNVAR